MALLLFALVISVVVGVHEYGHYLFARKYGVQVKTFSIGFGPWYMPLGTDKAGTAWKIGLLPLGGYVEPDATDMAAATPMQRFWIFFAGPLFSFAYGWLAVVFALLLLRDDISLLAASIRPFEYLQMMVAAVVVMLYDMVAMLFTFSPPEDLGSVLSIAQGGSNSYGEGGWLGVLFFSGILSLVLGVMNLLPLAMLDGGHMVQNALEAVRRRPLSARTLHWYQSLSIGFIVVLMVVAIGNDIGRFLL